jgi:protein NirF
VTIYDTQTLQAITEFKASAPSGIFFTHRAGRIGF